MRSSYISVLMFLFLLCSVYAINQDGFELPPVNIDSGNSNPSTSPSSSQGSFMPQMPVDFANILAAGMVGITIGILLAALAYMIGNFFGFPQMIGWSKNQLWESIYTMVLVATVLVFSLVVYLFPIGVPEALESNLQISFPEKAALSLDNVIHGEIDLSDLPKDKKEELETKGFITNENLGITNMFFTTYSHQIGLNVVYNIFTMEIGTNIRMFFQGWNSFFAEGDAKFSGQFLPGFKKIMNLSGTISNYLLTLLVVLYSQMGLLIFISGGSIFLFTFGVFFRCIPITRKLGSTLIALFITLYFAYPAFVLFVFSEEMYGTMTEEFAGVYMDEQWVEGLEGVDPNGIVVVGPYGLNQLESTSLKEGEVVLRFYSFIFPEYNYTVKKGSSIVCSGTNKLGEIVECDLQKFGPASLTVNPNSDDFKNKLEKALKESDLSLSGTPVIYTILLSQNNGTDTYYYPSQAKPLQFKVYFSKKCSSDLCYQYTTQVSSLLESNVTKDVRKQILGPVAEELKEGYPEGKAADVTLFATKAAILGLTGYFSGGNYEAILVATGLLFKSDINGFVYDEITCDPYTNMIATDYFKEGVSTYPEKAGATEMGFIDSMKDYFTTDFSFKDFFKTLTTNVKDYYGKSDYMSCSGGLGVVEGGQITSLVGSVLVGTGLKWQSMHITTLLAPIVYVFISFIYTIIFCVTFFKSLSESIGGDSSLLGLGKLL